MLTRPIFPVEMNRDQTNYFHFKDGMSTEQLALTHHLCTLFPYQEAAILAGNGSTDEDIAGKSSQQDVIQKVSDSIRRSKIKWLYPNSNTTWLYEKLMLCVDQANAALWGFNLHSAIDAIQYTEYHGNEQGHYGWHMDVGPSPINHRKVSVTVQLSGPDEYEGGHFMLWNKNKPQILPRRLGEIIIFPSFLLHRVTPVTKGIRKSLVMWVGGGSYK